MTSEITRRGLLALCLLAASPALAAQDAERFVKSVADGVLGAARARSVARFKSLLRAHADIPSIAIFSLGSYRKNLKKEQQGEYFGLVENFIAGVFADNAAKLAGQSLDVKSSQDAGDSVIVKSLLKQGGRTTPVAWRLTKRTGGYKFFDVNVDGIWLATAQKTNFTAVLKKNNGSIAALLAYLRK